jgi:integrase
MTDNEKSLTNEEYATLVEAAHDHSLRHGFTVHLIGQTGLKRNEAANFTPEWFDPEQQVVTVPQEQDGERPAKQHAARQIPLPASTAENIAKYIERLDSSVFHVSGSAIYDRVTTAGEHAGISRVSPRVLRHTYASRLYNSGLYIEDIAAVMGFRSGTLTMSWADYVDCLDFPNVDEYWKGNDRLNRIGG